MPEVYDNWERLVGAVLKREELSRIALLESFTSSIRSVSGISSETFDPAANSSHHSIRPIKFKEKKKATKNFQHNKLLGGGAFGDVFKGRINEHTLSASKFGSGIDVAVKKWRQECFHGRDEWLKQINYLRQLHHPNLIKLIGYCSEEENMILGYEFMPKGSLDSHLFGRGHSSLPWVTRIKVATDVARGLCYLHDLATPVIHRGCQTTNILLDQVSSAEAVDLSCSCPVMRFISGVQEFNAKLSDFGLARDGPSVDKTSIRTRVAGACGIDAPEYITIGRLTTKYDVSCLGVVLLELLSGLRALDTNRPRGKRYLVDWAKPYLGDERELLRIMDTKLYGQYPRNEAFIVAKLSLQCLSFNPKLRPQMAEVVVALEQL